MTFHSPHAFLLFLLLPLVYWWKQRATKRPSIRFSSIQNASKVERSLKQKLSSIPLILRGIAFCLLIIALARPQKGFEKVREINEGIAIEMVVDRSSSMSAEMVFNGRRLNRLDIVKQVFLKFVSGNKKSLKGRSSDLIGMISFARYAETISPLTLAHGAMPRFLETVKLAKPQTEEDGTAIGDAIALAAARLEKAEEVIKKQASDKKKSYDLKSKVMIVLTDGQQTAGKRNPIEAAKIAKSWGIKIYTIAVGGGESMSSKNTIFGSFLSSSVGSGADETILKSIASETGGKFYSAQNGKALERIYAEIDLLERSKIESLRYTDYKEFFVPFAVLAILLLSAELILANTYFRKNP